MEWQSKRRPAEPVSAVLFDFDGTISVLRCGWENVMELFMAEALEGAAGSARGAGAGCGACAELGGGPACRSGGRYGCWSGGEAGGQSGAELGRCAARRENAGPCAEAGFGSGSARASGGRPDRGLGAESGGGTVARDGGGPDREPGGVAIARDGCGAATCGGMGVRDMVRRYIDESAGVQTIFQMKWLAEQVRARSGAAICGAAANGGDGGAVANCSGNAAVNSGDGGRDRQRLPQAGSGNAEKTGGTAANCDAAMLKSGGGAAKTGAAATAPGPWEYKAEYNRRLMASVAERRQRLRDGVARAEEYMIKGSRELLEMLAGRGVALYVASGTDDADVKREVAALGLAGYFSEIRGAPEGREDCSKEAAIRELLGRKGVAGDRLAVVGDGKVEIAIGRENGARTLGVASDERALAGVNPVKRARLLKAGADAIVGDFADAAALEEFFFGGGYTGER